MTVVLGYGTTPHGLAALSQAANEAALRKTRLHLVRYVGYDATARPSRTRPEWTEIEDFERHLADVKRELQAQGVQATSEVQGGLRPGLVEALLETAAREEAELLVIGLRRRSPVGKLFIGSIVQEIVLNAPCPVLAVKAPSDQDDAG